MCFAPVGVLFFPRIFLRGCSRGQQCEQKSNEKPAGRTIPEAHEKVYRERKSAENEDKEKDVTARQITWARGFFELETDWWAAETLVPGITICKEVYAKPLETCRLAKSIFQCIRAIL